MPVTATTATAIVASLVAQIEAITPSHASEQQVKWQHAEDFEIKGTGPRTFDCVAHPELADPDGLHAAGGIGYFFIVDVVTSYGGLAPAVARRMVGDDGADLRVIFESLHASAANTLPVPDTYEIDDKVLEDEEGNGTLVAVFRFLVRFKRADT